MSEKEVIDLLDEREKEGVKFDSGKLRMDLLPTDALEALARILTDGADKYGARNWEKGMAWSRPYAALLRHLLAWWGRLEYIDTMAGLAMQGFIASQTRPQNLALELLADWAYNMAEKMYETRVGKIEKGLVRDYLARRNSR